MNKFNNVRFHPCAHLESIQEKLVFLAEAFSFCMILKLNAAVPDKILLLHSERIY